MPDLTMKSAETEMTEYQFRYEEIYEKVSKYSEVNKEKSSEVLRLLTLTDCITSVFEVLEEAKLPDVDAITIGALQLALLDRTIEFINTPGRSTNSISDRINKLLRLLHPNTSRELKFFLLTAVGVSLQSMGDREDPKLSRERVRQIVSKFEKKLGIKSREIANDVTAYAQATEEMFDRQIIEKWIKDFGRLPIKDDPDDQDEIGVALREDIVGMTLSERVKLLEVYGIEISKEEYDYHETFINTSKQKVGTGYWEFDRLKEYLVRFSNKRYPGKMPKQLDLPRGVSGVVQSFGGQVKVAELCGLIYQGQIRGADGRTYWTEEATIDFIDQLLTFLGKEWGYEIKTKDVSNYLKSGEHEYLNYSQNLSAMQAIERFYLPEKKS